MNNSKLLITRLKSYLRSKGITYSELAKSLKVSEPTIKRWFSTGNISLKQMDSILSFIKVDLADLVMLDDDKTTSNYFSEAQEELFYKDEKLLVLFYLLASGATVKSILKKYKFTKDKLTKQLITLERYDLIEYYTDSHIKVLVDTSTLWRPMGILSQKYFKDFRNDFMNSHFTGTEEASWFFYGRLSKNSYEVLKKKFEQLSKEIKELYYLDRKDTSSLNRSLLIGMRPWDFNLIKKYKV